MCTDPTPDEVEQDGADFICPECAGAAFISGQTVSSLVLVLTDFYRFLPIFTEIFGLSWETSTISGKFSYSPRCVW